MTDNKLLNLKDAYKISFTVPIKWKWNLFTIYEPV